jgi:hypothetical protein
MSEIDVLRPVDALADKGAAVPIEQHNADAGTVGQIFNAHCDSDRLGAADTRTLDDPQFGQVCHQRCIAAGEELAPFLDVGDQRFLGS